MTTSKSQNHLSDRLQNGAAMLGRLWKRKQHCVRGWAIDPHEYIEDPFELAPCGCDVVNDFCKARQLWLTLAVQNGQPIVPGEQGLARTMTPEQMDATQLTLTFDVDGTPIKVGQKGMMTAVHFDQLMKDPDSARSIFALLKAFPKARVEGIMAADVIGLGAAGPLLSGGSI